MPTTPSITRSVACGTLSTTRPPASVNAASAGAVHPLGVEHDRRRRATPRRRRNVAAHSASPPLSPEPTTAQTRAPGDRRRCGRAVRGRSRRPDRRRPDASATPSGRLCQQRRFGVADGVRGVVVPHRAHVTSSSPSELAYSGRWHTRFDVDAVRIEHERAVVIRLVLGPQTRFQQQSCPPAVSADVVERADASPCPRR